MTRWKLTLEYDGTDFAGWQRQDSVMSVQQTIEEAISKFSGETARLHVAGRTDAGVHAFGQVAHFDLSKNFSADTIRSAINFHVQPNKVAVILAEATDENFHARFGAKERVYRYQIINRRPPAMLLANRAWHVTRPLDTNAMQQVANLLLGQHDFSTFRAQNCQAKSPIRTLDECTITREGEIIAFKVRSRSFLYHQVRNMVGTLGMVGSGQWTLDDFKNAFAARDRSKGGPTAPAHGLFFVSVSY